MHVYIQGLLELGLKSSRGRARACVFSLSVLLHAGEPYAAVTAHTQAPRILSTKARTHNNKKTLTRKHSAANSMLGKDS